MLFVNSKSIEIKTITMKHLIFHIVFFSFVPVAQQLSAQACIDSTLIDADVLCAELWDPVCGCNGITYANDCVATFTGGAVSVVPGECSGANGDCIDLGGIDFGACDMAMGVALINGSCQFLSGCGWEVDDQNYQVYAFESLEECSFACDETSRTQSINVDVQNFVVFPNPSEGAVSVAGMRCDVEWKVYSCVGELFCSKRGPFLNLELPRGAWIVAVENGATQRVIVR